MEDDIEDIEIEPDENDCEDVQNILMINHIQTQEDVTTIDVAANATMPEQFTLWLMTFGCAHNFADGEYMKGLLVDYGYVFTDKREQADLWVLNSCTVKDPSEMVFRNYVVEGERLGKKLVLAGCVPQGIGEYAYYLSVADSEAEWMRSLSILGVKQIHRIVEVVEETLKGNCIQLLSQKGLPPLSIPKVRRDPHIEIIPISEGCLGHCTYCKTRYARGRLQSYPIEAICDRVKQSIDDGVYDIWLSSEDTGAYGIDLGLNIEDLLKSILASLPKGCNTMIRLGMTNPPYILHHLEYIKQFLQHPNVYSFLHIPVQSGSNCVLDAMQRQYTKEEFEAILDYLLPAVPGLTIATDIIVGFATETEEDHQQTMKLLKKYELPIVNISKFFPRPGTPAARMHHISSTVVKPRSTELSSWFKSLQPYTPFLHSYELVWVGSECSGAFIVAHTKAYIKVLIQKEELQGKAVVVRIVDVSRFHIVGEIIDRYPAPIQQAMSPKELSLLINAKYGQ